MAILLLFFSFVVLDDEQQGLLFLFPSFLLDEYAPQTVGHVRK